MKYSIIASNQYKHLLFQVYSSIVALNTSNLLTFVANIAFPYFNTYVRQSK